MHRVKNILLLAIVGFAAFVGWRVGSCELANMAFQDDIHDLALSPTSPWSYQKVMTVDDFRDAVINKARDHGIDLTPNEVTVRRDGDQSNSPMYISAQYSVPIHVASYEFTLHFSPKSTTDSTW